MNKTIVITISGKYTDDTADTVSVHLFDSEDHAQEYCKTNTTEKKKYWTKSAIVNEAYSNELYYDSI